jgi:hypothetical protein
VLTDLPPVPVSVAIIGAGGTAGIVQGSTVLLRLKSSAATAGTGNVFLASLELLGSLIMSVASLLLPLLALLLVAGFIFFAMWRLARLRHRRVSDWASTLTPALNRVQFESSDSECGSVDNSLSSIRSLTSLFIGSVLP